MIAVKIVISYVLNIGSIIIMFFQNFPMSFNIKSREQEYPGNFNIFAICGTRTRPTRVAVRCFNHSAIIGHLVLVTICIVIVTTYIVIITTYIAIITTYIVIITICIKIITIYIVIVAMRLVIIISTPRILI